jgi:itaconate CoA-transferase
MLGDKAMYEFMDYNPSTVDFPASWVNNPSIIRKNKNMVSINSAIEVDLTRKINSERINGIPFSGTGGQLIMLIATSISVSTCPSLCIKSFI